jgi:hypothetical protein
MGNCELGNKRNGRTAKESTQKVQPRNLAVGKVISLSLSLLLPSLSLLFTSPSSSTPASSFPLLPSLFSFPLSIPPSPPLHLLSLLSPIPPCLLLSSPAFSHTYRHGAQRQLHHGTPLLRLLLLLLLALLFLRALCVSVLQVCVIAVVN